MRLNQGSDLVLSLSLLELRPGSRTPGSRAETEMPGVSGDPSKWSARGAGMGAPMLKTYSSTHDRRGNCSPGAQQTAGPARMLKKSSYLAKILINSGASPTPLPPPPTAPRPP